MIYTFMHISDIYRLKIKPRNIPPSPLSKALKLLLRQEGGMHALRAVRRGEDIDRKIDRNNIRIVLPQDSRGVLLTRFQHDVCAYNKQ